MRKYDIDKFPARLKSARKAKGLSLNATVKKLDTVNQAQLCRFEDGTHKPSFYTLVKLANFYGVSIDWLCGKDDEEGIWECVVEGNDEA